MVDSGRVKIQLENVKISFGAVEALKSLTLGVYENEILGVIGPANSGKTTFLRSLNRLNDDEPHYRCQGRVLLDGVDVKTQMNPETLRRRVGMIFALPMPLPLSIYENIAYGPRRQGVGDRKILDQVVEESLRSAFLWEEVRDRLMSSAMKLSGGQQQRLCIARTLALKPEVLLFDEPCSGLDPISTAKVEESMLVLKRQYTLVLVTNNTKQAARVSDRVAFFLMGELIEIDQCGRIFTSPRDKRTEEYILGKFG